jgi:Bacterial extracellular solute-binding protein
VSTHIFRSLVLLVFVSSLVAFFLMNPGRWLSPRVAEPLVVRLKVTPDLKSWLEHARTRFLENNPHIARHPLSLAIAYEEDAAASGAIAERLRAIASPSAPLSTDAAWLTSRAAVHLLEATHRIRIPDKAVVPLASTLLAVAMWETRARDILPSAGVILPRPQPVAWRDVEVSWEVGHHLSVGTSQGSLSGRISLRWAIPHPLRSAAGLASLALMSLSHAGLQGVQWPNEQIEQLLLPWLGDFLRTVHRFRPSAHETANDFIKYGPSQADVCSCPSTSRSRS